MPDHFEPPQQTINFRVVGLGNPYSRCQMYLRDILLYLIRVAFISRRFRFRLSYNAMLKLFG